ncbi:MAG: glycerophosphodiester phosphodiesterase [Acidimicrobiia bacterium]
MRPYLEGEHPIRFAHRGGAALWPENTATAFQGAYDLGIRYLETDVHLTADGVLVTFHDHHLDRLTNGTGKVTDWLWRDLQLLDAAYGFRPGDGFPQRGTGLGVPRFDDMLTAFPGAKWNVDMKHSAAVEALADVVTKLGAEDRVMASSFFDHRLSRFRKATGDRVATSAGPRQVAMVKAAARFGKTASIAADALQVPERARAVGVVDTRLIEAAHRAEVAVHVWTVNDAPTMNRLLDLGVDGIMTDRPDILVEVVSQRGE